MKKIPDSELKIMQIIWSAENEISTKLIEKSLTDDYDTQWTFSTIQSLLNRLTDKQFITSVKHGKERYYTAVVDKAVYVKAETTDFLEKMHSNSIVSLFAALHDSHGITKDQRRELKEMLGKDE